VEGGKRDRETLHLSEGEERKQVVCCEGSQAVPAYPFLKGGLKKK
jgi:hypothetical protein